MFEIVKYLLDVFLKVLPDIAKLRQSTENHRIITALVEILALIDELAIDAVRIDIQIRHLAQSTSDMAVKSGDLLSLDALNELFDLQISRLNMLVKELEKYIRYIIIADGTLRAELEQIVDEKRGLVSRYMRFARVHGAQYSTLMLPAEDTLHAGEAAGAEARIQQWQLAVRAAPVVSLEVFVRVGESHRQPYMVKSPNTAALEEMRARFRQGLIETFGREQVMASLGRQGA